MMQHDTHQKSELQLAQGLDLTQQVFFDPETVTLLGAYTDQLGAYRARKVWSKTFEQTFLLNIEGDFKFSIVRPASESEQYVLKCEFLSACARYAFWRLTNNQSPEAQYIIETAHIPESRSNHNAIIAAPDMRPIHAEPLVLGHNLFKVTQESMIDRLVQRLVALIKKMR